MGEAADDLINGDACESCGEWLGDGDGYPRQCNGCKSPAQQSKSVRMVKPVKKN